MSPRIFDPSHERAARPRNLRPEVPQVFTGSAGGFPQQFGPTYAPWLSDRQVLGLPGAWRAVNRIANGVAGMAPLAVKAADGITDLDVPPIISRPNTSIGVFDFWHQAVATALMRGNFVGMLADFDPAGYARQAVPVPPHLIDCRYGGDGFTEYWIGGNVYGPLDVVHVRAFALPGSPWGIGPVEVFRRSLGHALEQQHLAADTYSRGSVPSGILTVDRARLDKTQALDTQQQWIDAHGDGRRAPAVLPQNWTFTPLSWSPEDSQFLEARQFSIAELALMFGLDPTDLGASFGGGPSVTYANVEQREITRITDAYGPWMRRFEQAFSDLIPAANYAHFVPERLLRTDSKTRAEVHQINIASGVETVDEAREVDGKPPAPAKPKPDIPAPFPLDPALPSADPAAIPPVEPSNV